MNRNLHYGKLPPLVASKLLQQMPGSLVAGCYRTSESSEQAFAYMRMLSLDVSAVSTLRCFVCSDVDTHCPENHRVVCLCGRTFYKYYDVTDYTNFVERSRWHLIWNRLSFKTLFTLKKPA